MWTTKKIVWSRKSSTITTYSPRGLRIISVCKGKPQKTRISARGLRKLLSVHNIIDHGDGAVLHVDYKKHRLAMKVLEGNDFVYVDYE